VRLAGKGWRRLQFNLSEQEDEQLARLGLNPREMTSEPQRLHALQLADAAAKPFLPEAQFESVQRRAAEIQARVTPVLPATVHAELRPYQLEGFQFLAYLSTNHFGGILADDMGLGKTLQTLAWLAWLREGAAAAGGKAPIPPSLVVCPKSVTDNWRAEAARFVPGLRVKVWGSGEAAALPDHLRDADLHVLNYTQLRALEDALPAARWLAVILDEGQYIKNPSSQTAIVARLLQAQHRLVLTGTPIENRLLDLWSLMSFAMPGALGSRAGFGRLFDAKEDPFARRRLAARVRPFLLRRTKSQVAKDLPDRIEEDLFCELEGVQKTLYRAELKRAQQMLLRVTTQKQLNTERFTLLTSLLRLRQICCHPRLVQDSARGPAAKVEALLEQLEPLMEEGQKVLVFSQFVSMLELLREALAEKGWPLFFLSGETEDRGELVQQFQAAEGAGIFLISLKAGGFGLNLTAASYVVLFDPWWNPAVENQAIDRTHRIGQLRKVIAYRLLIKDSIEQKIRALQRQKKALAEDVLGEEKFAQALTLDDLRFLFAD
jgi:SNF2 family DNA or RNA helicase